jgi:AbrB family looped-hinge helix DNA binding protein
MENGIMYGMDITIDSAGRVVLPKRLRDRFRLTAGTVIEVQERAGELVLRPKEQSAAVIQRNGRWVYVGEVPEGFDWDNMIENERDERAREILGL